MIMKILITGNQGFIGYWLSKRLMSEGCTVLGIDNQSSFGERQCLKENHTASNEQLCVDLCKPALWQTEAAEFDPEVVIHLAAQAILPRSYRDPFETVQNNIISTQHVLDFCNNSETVKSLVCVTSDKVYENNGTGQHFSEEDTLGGKDAYSLSKTTCELLCKAYHITHRKNINLSIQTARLGNVVGGGDWSVDRLIPDLMRAVVNKSIFSIRYMNATRPFQHVDDVVEGLIKLARSGLHRTSNYDFWNIGPRENSFCEVADVVSLAERYFGKLQIKQSNELYKEDMLLAVDNTKYTRTFGEPKWNSIESVDKALLWYIENGVSS